jgi:hypothetical protein
VVAAWGRVDEAKTVLVQGATAVEPGARLPERVQVVIAGIVTAKCRPGVIVESTRARTLEQLPALLALRPGWCHRSVVALPRHRFARLAPPLTLR